jgi:hypothetical protein
MTQLFAKPVLAAVLMIPPLVTFLSDATEVCGRGEFLPACPHWFAPDDAPHPEHKPGATGAVMVVKPGATGKSTTVIR